MPTRLHRRLAKGQILRRGHQTDPTKRAGPARPRGPAARTSSAQEYENSIAPPGWGLSRATRRPGSLGQLCSLGCPGRLSLSGNSESSRENRVETELGPMNRGT
jgi:hypothetical protein